MLYVASWLYLPGLKWLSALLFEWVVEHNDLSALEYSIVIQHLGHWYMQHGEHDQAERLICQSLGTLPAESEHTAFMVREMRGGLLLGIARVYLQVEEPVPRCINEPAREIASHHQIDFDVSSTEDRISAEALFELSRELLEGNSRPT